MEHGRGKSLEEVHLNQLHALAKTLSGLRGKVRPNTGGALAGKTTKELMAEAAKFPELRDLLEGME